jgi:hypothetical protein
MKRADKALERRAGPDHHEQRKLFIMADPEIITIPLHLPAAEAWALVQLASWIDPEHCACFAPWVDVDVSMSATTRLLGALVGAGFKPV